jgi:hypothetical protein
VVMTAQLLGIGIVAFLALWGLPFLLDKLERDTVSASAIVGHAVRNRRTSPEQAEQLVALMLGETVAEVFGERNRPKGST